MIRDTLGMLTRRLTLAHWRPTCTARFVRWRDLGPFCLKALGEGVVEVLGDEVGS